MPPVNENNNNWGIAHLLGVKVDGEEIEKLHTDLKEIPELCEFGKHHYLTFKHSGIDLYYDNTTKTISVIFLYAEGESEHNQFTGIIPFGLRFVDSRDNIRSELGQPARSGKMKRHLSPPANSEDDPDGSKFLETFKNLPLTIQWDMYNVGPFNTHFSFDEKDGKLIQITIMST